MFDLLSYSFMRHAFLAASAISLFAPLLGVFLLLRRQSLLSDTLSHVSLAGVAFGLFFGLNPSWTTLLIVVAASFLLEYLRRVYQHYMELATAILMSAGLALALLLISASSDQSISLDQYLFGSIVTISSTQVWLLFGLAVLILLAFSLFLRPLYVMTFDEDTAQVDGLPVRLMSTVFNIVTGLAIAQMIPAAGALLVSAIMVLPASIAMLIGRSFKQVLIFSVLIGFLGMNIGILASFYFNAPASALITLIFIGFFLLVTLVKGLAHR